MDTGLIIFSVIVIFCFVGIPLFLLLFYIIVAPYTLNECLVDTKMKKTAELVLASLPKSKRSLRKKFVKLVNNHFFLLINEKDDLVVWLARVSSEEWKEKIRYRIANYCDPRIKKVLDAFEEIQTPFLAHKNNFTVDIPQHLARVEEILDDLLTYFKGEEDIMISLVGTQPVSRE